MKLHSIKLPHFNNAANAASAKLKTPSRVIISMSQHGGVPCTPVVSVGDRVKTGQLIGKAEAAVSSPVHSSVTGTVTDKIQIMNVYGKLNDALVIDTELREELSDDIAPPVINNRRDFIEAVRKSGSVGLGGAGFPTYLKLDFDPKTVNIDTLVINGAECEPYITSDFRTFMEEGEKVADGIRLIMKQLELKKAVIGIETDKKPVIRKMMKLTENDPDITIVPLNSEYPQGAEKVLIYNTTGRVVHSGELPSAAGCIVLNCSTVAFISDYIKTGIPLIRRRITIDGNIVNKPANLIVPIGTMISDIITASNLSKQPDRVLLGGPMMGTAIYDASTPIQKTSNAVLMFAETKEYAPTACIRCGRCVNACSMGLMPTELEHAFDRKDAELLKKLNINLCINCGACTFVCPAKRNISEKNQLAKLFVREQSKSV